MRHLNKVVFIALVLFMCKAVLAGGNPANVPMIFGSFTPEVGAWSKYETLDKKTGRKLAITVAVVGQQGEMYWYEVIDHTKGADNIVKMLVKGDPKNPENIQRLIIKSGVAQAREMPGDFVRMGRMMADNMFAKHSGVRGDPAEMTLTEIGRSQVTVRAGSFEVVTNRITDGAGKEYGTYNYSAKVKPFGLLTSDTEDSSMQLIAFGKDAKSAISEEPVLIKMPPGMLNVMQQGIMPGMGENHAGR